MEKLRGGVVVKDPPANSGHTGDEGSQGPPLPGGRHSPHCCAFESQTFWGRPRGQYSVQAAQVSPVCCQAGSNPAWGAGGKMSRQGAVGDWIVPLEGALLPSPRLPSSQHQRCCHQRKPTAYPDVRAGRCPEEASCC